MKTAGTVFQTYRHEVADRFNELDEDNRRLVVRGDIKQWNQMLAETAHNAGVITNEEFAIFQNAGYMGLYGGLDVDDIESLLQDVSNKICYSCKYHHTVAIGACDLYWNSMLCERLDGRTWIFLKSNLFIGVIYIYFHANIYYHISMKGDSI